jgi:hypothetical protein
LKVHFLFFYLNVTFFEKSFNCDEISLKISALAKSPTYLRCWLNRKKPDAKESICLFSQRYIMIFSAKKLKISLCPNIFRKQFCASSRLLKTACNCGGITARGIGLNSRHQATAAGSAMYCVLRILCARHPIARVHCKKG